MVEKTTRIRRESARSAALRARHLRVKLTTDIIRRGRVAVDIVFRITIHAGVVDVEKHVAGSLPSLSIFGPDSKHFFLHACRLQQIAGIWLPLPPKYAFYTDQQYSK